MRISDDRYSRDRLRFDLALRFIRLEARTQTIRTWTGLTDDRIRKLYRSYVRSASGSSVRRHRGKSPRQAAFFTRSPRLLQESATFASICTLLGVVPARMTAKPAANRLGTAAATHASATPAGGTGAAGADRAAQTFVRGERLCDAFEAYRAVVAEPQITFEHAVFLVGALSRGDELRLGPCALCGALVVADRLALREVRCASCAEQTCPPPAAPAPHAAGVGAAGAKSRTGRSRVPSGP